MKKLAYLAIAAMVLSACSAPAPKPCNAYSQHPTSAPVNPCGPEVVINKTWSF